MPIGCKLSRRFAVTKMKSGDKAPPASAQCDVVRSQLHQSVRYGPSRTGCSHLAGIRSVTPCHHGQGWLANNFNWACDSPPHPPGSILHSFLWKNQLASRTLLRSRCWTMLVRFPQRELNGPVRFFRHTSLVSPVFPACADLR